MALFWAFCERYFCIITSLDYSHKKFQRIKKRLSVNCSARCYTEQPFPVVTTKDLALDGGEWQLKTSESQGGPQIREQLVMETSFSSFSFLIAGAAMHMQKLQFRCAGRTSRVRTTDLMCSPSSPAAAVWFGRETPLFCQSSAASLELHARPGRAAMQRGLCGWMRPLKWTWETKDEVLERNFLETALILGETEGARLGGWNKTWDKVWEWGKKQNPCRLGYFNLNVWCNKLVQTAW